MQDYITALLEGNEATETYHGIAFQRKLTLRTLHGSHLTVTDPGAISSALQNGKSYDFVIAVGGVQKVRAFTNSITESSKFSGTIRSLKWNADPDAYLVFNDELVGQPMTLVGTIHGSVLLSRMLLGGVSVGNAVTWGRAHYDLVAVRKKGI